MHLTIENFNLFDVTIQVLWVCDVIYHLYEYSLCDGAEILIERLHKPLSILLHNYYTGFV